MTNEPLNQRPQKRGLLIEATFTAGIIVLLVSKFLDFRSSLYFPYYGLTEGVKVFADKDGNFSPVKGAIATAIILAVYIVSYIFLGLWALVVVVPTAVASLIAANHNIKKAKINRQKQIEQLPAFLNPLGFVVLMVNKNGKTYYPLFRWLDSEKKDPHEAEVEVYHKLVAFAKNPVFPH